MRKKITHARLAELGIKGNADPWEWEGETAVQNVEHERGSVIVVFEDEPGRFWQLEVEHHPEDWSGTNDLLGQRPEAEFEVDEVEKKVREVWVLKG